MRVLVTRAEPGAAETAARLVAMGHEVVRAPMLSIEDVAANADISQFVALLFTSANGVAAFARTSAARDLPAYCVGDATGEAARRVGFRNVRIGGGDVRALADFVAQSRRPVDGALLHVSGADIAGDLVRDLSLRGFTIERRVFYRAVAAATLPADAETALKSAHSNIRAALFHSGRGAKAFVDIVKHNIDCTRITALCQSDTVAAAASALAWRDILVAQAPRDDALIALVAAVPE